MQVNRVLILLKACLKIVRHVVQSLSADRDLHITLSCECTSCFLEENHKLEFVEVIKFTAFDLFGESYDVDSASRHVVPVAALVHITEALLLSTFYLSVRIIGRAVLSLALRRLSAEESSRVDLSFIELSRSGNSKEGGGAVV